MANPDVREAGLDPLAHYHLTGWRDGHNPSRTFDVRHYLQQHGDVALAGMDPLLHWIWAGRREGRTTRPLLDAERRQLAQAEDPRRRAL